MPQAGGSAAINGFLYQIVHHIGWLAEARLSGTLTGEIVEEAHLVLEPQGGGGDARASHRGMYLVEQYKTRSGRTWSVQDVAAVLVDLRKAVPPTLPPHARYRFVTDGEAGLLDGFNAFLANVRSTASEDELNDTDTREFGPGLVTTDRQFFEHIIAATRSVSSNHDALQERVVVFHLLARFEMEFGCDGGDRAKQVETLLRRYAPDLGDERRIREHLVGVLVETLSRGEARLDGAGIDAIFSKVGLKPDRLRKVATLPEALAVLTQRRLEYLRYRSSHDVRQAPAWPAEKAALVIAGASGSGKTWQLACLLKAAGNNEQLATLVPSATTAEEAMVHAARDVWQLALGETSDKTLAAVSIFLRELTPDSPAPRLIVALDDVRSIDMARNLVRQDWESLGMRLVITTPRSVATALQLTDGAAVHVHAVEEFTTDELDTLLKRNGRRWAELPADLKRLLRNPILAGLYLGLPYASVGRAPRSEYEIFEGFWQRIAATGRAGDDGIVIAMAAHALQEGSYPVPRAQWRAIGLDDSDAAARLESAGWVTMAEGGDLAFAHDRLLNWAAAKSLVLQFHRGRLSVEDLGAVLTRDPADTRQPLGRRLGYLPMDTLWLLTADAKNTRLVRQLIARMEASGASGERLYVDHLPTLGERTVPVLLDRLAQLPEDASADYQVRLIGRSLGVIAQQDGVDLRAAVREFLYGNSRNGEAVAIAVLTINPDERYLDRLWELHAMRHDALRDRSRDSRFSDYDASFAAMQSAVARNPQWLRDRAFSVDPQREPITELAYLLNALDHADAPTIWAEVATTLIEKVPADRPRSLLYCIARFKDRQRQDFVVQNLARSEDHAAGAALAALSVLDARTAIDQLVRVDDFARELFRNEWLPILLRAEPRLSRERILDLARTHPKGRRLIEDLFADRPDAMDEMMFDFLLTTLERDFEQGLDAAIAGDPQWIYMSLRVAAEVSRPELLLMLESRAGGALEQMLTTVAISRLRRVSRTVDHVLESCRRMLILMGGDGIANLVRQELESQNYWVRHSGLLWAATRADDGIIERLANIAGRALPRDANGKPDSNSYMEFHMAVSALAALGADAALVESLQRSGVTDVPTDLAELRAHRGPMAQSLTAAAVRPLENEEAQQQSQLMALVVAWLSGDRSLIPHARSVLERAAPGGQVARFACIALCRLGETSEAFARLAERMLYAPESTFWALNALIGLGDQGLERIASWVERSQRGRRSQDQERAIRALYQNPATRMRAINAAIAHSIFDIAAEAADTALREQIVDKAFGARSAFASQTVEAIEGLAKFDVARAVEAIELALETLNGQERRLCQLMVHVAPAIAAPTLVRRALSVNRPALTHAVALALRALELPDIRQLLIQHMSGTAHERRVAADLAGWLPDPALSEALGRLADHDSAREVRQAALAALTRHATLSNVQALLAEFATAEPKRRWSVLTAILRQGDPYLLTDPTDALCLESALAGAPFALTHHAEHVLRNRVQREKQK